MVFLLILVLALGGLAYVGGLEHQSAQASAAAQRGADAHARELLLYRATTSGLQVANGGPGSSEVVAMYFRYPNGSVYYGSAFSPVLLPEGAGAPVQGMVPSGTCLPSGTSTCLARFGAIYGSQTPGYSVGLVTSLGNTFWYIPGTQLVDWSSITSLPEGCSSGEYVAALGPQLTCSQVGWNQLVGYPSGCAADQYVTAVGSTLTCSAVSVKWGAIGGFPAGCPAGQFISALSASPTCGSAGGSARLCTAVATGGTGSLTCSSLPAYAYYLVQFSGQASGKYSYQLYVRFNGVSSPAYAEGYPEPNQAWYNCGYSNADSGFDVLTDDAGYTAFTMNVAAAPGSGYLATWSSMSISSLSTAQYPNLCTGAGAFPTTSGLDSITVLNSGTTWVAGSALTVYGFGS